MIINLRYWHGMSFNHRKLLIASLSQWKEWPIVVNTSIDILATITVSHSNPYAVWIG